jgi:hypothetical protein
MKPRFYNLGPQLDRSPQEPPKVDGLACAFLVGAQDVLNYNLFYDCIVAILSAGSHPSTSVSVGAAGLESCARHYHFLVIWRLLGTLPPSPKFLGQLKLVVVVVVVVAWWEIPGFDWCCLGTLSSIPMCPHIWPQRRTMSSHIISHCHPHLVITSCHLVYAYP